MTGPDLQKAAEQAGGKLIEVPLSRERFTQHLSYYAPGCGAPTHVDGTNGGEMPCGGMLTQLDGTERQYLCALCDTKVRQILQVSDGVWIARNPHNNAMLLVEVKAGVTIAAPERTNIGHTVDGLMTAGWTLWSKIGESTA